MRTSVLALGVCAVLAATSHAGPGTISYQGSVLTSSGGAVADATYRMQFTLYDAPVGGTNRWSETQNVPVRGGLFSTSLGLSMPLHPVFMTYPDLWLLVLIDVDRSGSFEPDEVFQPLQRMNGSLWASHRVEPNDESPNLIGGHADNVSSPGVAGSVIGGGGSELSPNRVTDDFSVVAGGSGNQAGDDDPGRSTYGQFVGGGAGNKATGHVSVVVGGYQNNSEGEGSGVVSGLSNEAMGGYSFVGAGQNNSTSGSYAVIPGGRAAIAPLYGQMAHAAGSFGGRGNAQESFYVLRNTTDDDSYESLFLDGINDRLTVPDGRTIAFNILVVARSNTGESGGASIKGVAENQGGTINLIGTPLVIALGSEDPSWSATVEAYSPGDALDIVVRGAVGKTIRWVATVRTAEVAW